MEREREGKNSAEITRASTRACRSTKIVFLFVCLFFSISKPLSAVKSLEEEFTWTS